jgi:hypothetical protein
MPYTVVSEVPITRTTNTSHVPDISNASQVSGTSNASKLHTFQVPDAPYKSEEPAQQDLHYTAPISPERRFAVTPRVPPYSLRGHGASRPEY